MKTVDISTRGWSLTGRAIPQRFRVDVMYGAVKGGLTFPQRCGYVVRLRYFYSSVEDAVRYAETLRTNRVAWRIFDRAARCWLKPHASVICRGW